MFEIRVKILILVHLRFCCNAPACYLRFQVALCKFYVNLLFYKIHSCLYFLKPLDNYLLDFNQISRNSRPKICKISVLKNLPNLQESICIGVCNVENEDSCADGFL